MATTPIKNKTDFEIGECVVRTYEEPSMSTCLAPVGSLGEVEAIANNSGNPIVRFYEPFRGGMGFINIGIENGYGWAFPMGVGIEHTDKSLIVEPPTIRVWLNFFDDKDKEDI